MILTIGEPGDSETDPTVLWPKNRRADDPVLLFRSPSYATSHTRRQRDL
jgi:catalase